MKIKSKLEFSFYDVKDSSDLEHHTRAMLKLIDGSLCIGVRVYNEWVEEGSYCSGVGGDITSEVLEFSTDINN